MQPQSSGLNFIQGPGGQFFLIEGHTLVEQLDFQTFAWYSVYHA
jgi:hypothetical protein